MPSRKSAPTASGVKPANAASVAGAKLLREQGVIAPATASSASSRGTKSRTDGDGRLPHHATRQRPCVLGSCGVSRAAFANRAVKVENDLNEIVQAIQLNS